MVVLVLDDFNLPFFLTDKWDKASDDLQTEITLNYPRCPLLLQYVFQNLCVDETNLIRTDKNIPTHFD